MDKNDNLIKEFKKKVKELKKHNNLYTYDNVDYKNTDTHVMITCKKHGDFWAWIFLFVPVIFLMIMMIGMFAVAMKIVKSTNLNEESKSA